MEQLTKIVSEINGFLWGMYCLIPLLCGVGIYFTLKLDFIQIRRFGLAVKSTFGGLTLHGERAGKQGMSSFQSLATAIAAQVGTGNLAGAATAIAMGGPGAIFWMWIAAFFGMATIFAEAVLAQTYKTTDDQGLLIGVIISALAAFVFFGGMGRIAAFTEKVVPIMAALYLLGGLIVLLANASHIIPALKMVFVGAFDPAAATGGIIGAGVKEAMRYGVARGLFSNEAGMGSTPHAHAVAKVKYPAQQGFVAIVGVFVDTFIVLNMTAFVIFVTNYIDGSTTGIALTQKAFESGLGSFGITFVAICLFFFAFSTIIGWYFFGEQNIKYLFGTKGTTPYRLIVMGFIVLGSVLQVDLVWELADMFNGLMVLPNLIALIGLSKIVSMALRDYDANNPR